MGRKQTKAAKARIYARLFERWPNARCELDYENPFQLLLAVLLSAQATDVSVNKALGALRQELPGFGAGELVEMGESAFLQRIKSIGLAPTKARNSITMARILLREHGGSVPSERAALEALPGVGRKTANVVLNELHGEATLAVDTHVARVSQRIGLVDPSDDPRKIEDQLVAEMPAEYARRAHIVLIFHGRYLCTARAPQCSACPVEADCLKRGL